MIIVQKYYSKDKFLWGADMELSFDELDDWYSQKIKEKTKLYVYEVERLLKKINDDLDHLIPISQDFMSGHPKAPEEANNAAARLGEKIIELIDEFFKFPEEILYEDIESLMNNMEKFHNSIMKYGRIWVPQLSKEFKPKLKRMDFFIKELQKKAFLLKKIQAKYSWIKQLQSVFEKAKSIKKDLGPLQKLVDEKNILQKELDELGAKIKEKENEIESFKKSARLNELDNIDDMLENIKAEINQILNVYQKAFKKILNSLKNTKLSLSFEFQQNLNAYYDNPVEAFLKEDIGYPNLITFLKELNNVLKQESFSLKSQDIRRIEKKTKQIVKDKILLPLQEQYFDLIKKRETLYSEEHKKSISKLESELNTLKEEYSSIKFKLDELQHRILEKKEKILLNKESLEKLILKNVGEEVTILLSLPE